MPSHGPGDASSGGTIVFLPDGRLVINERFYAAQRAWYVGLGAMARAGAGIIVDEVLLRGEPSQAELRGALDGLTVAWVGVRCRLDVAEARELARGDRVLGMARDQADRVHAGVEYDLLVDTSEQTVGGCARATLSALSLT